MKTLFVFIALVVMHMRAMISSFVRLHVLPQLDGTSCASLHPCTRFSLVDGCVQSVSVHGVVEVAVWLTVTMHLQGLQWRHLLPQVYLQL